ncbi:hypothetical protein K1719_016874 [Acacia pycnantha]|nr:hypothetical protein K1719_016874 [Acacia pycnantha]
MKQFIRRLARVADSSQSRDGLGDEMERFVVSAELLNHPIFVKLLNKSAQEYGYESTTSKASFKFPVTTRACLRKRWEEGRCCGKRKGAPMIMGEIQFLSAITSIQDWKRLTICLYRKTEAPNLNESLGQTRATGESKGTLFSNGGDSEKVIDT